LGYKNKEYQKKYYKRWCLANPDYFKEHRKKDVKGEKEYQEQWHFDNPEYNKQWCLDHPGYGKQYYLDHKGEIAEKAREYYLNHKEECKKYYKRWCLNHPGYRRQWYLKHPEYIKQFNQGHKKKYNEYYNNRYKTDLKFNLNRKMSVAIGISLKGNKEGRHWEDLVDFTYNELKEHLEKTMPKGYTWNDYLNGKLHIDHSIPISVFNFTKPEHIDFKRCWALDNLRLIPAEENQKKNNKLDEPFQPALAM